MKKIISTIFILILLIGLVGCGDSTETKAIEQGKLLLAQLEYDKALGSFELAINEGTKDEEVKKIVNIIEDYKKSQKLIEEENMEDAKKILDQIDETYKNYAIKEDIDKLKDELNEYEEENKVIDEKLNIVDGMLSEGRYIDAKSKLEEILVNEELSKIHKEKLEAKLKKIDEELIKIEEKEKDELEAKKKEEENSRKEAEKLKIKVANYRAKYPGGEDPGFTWNDARNIIIKVIGSEDETFYYNGRTDIKMSNDGRRYYYIWKEDPNASCTAEGTMSAYDVFDDGTVTPY